MGHIGVAMFVFEGNAAIMNVRSETKNKDRYPKLLILSIITTLILFMSFALVCYLTYGQNT
jgi:proton-coupled amino acid transporter